MLPNVKKRFYMTKVDLLICFTSELTTQEAFKFSPQNSYSSKMERHQPWYHPFKTIAKTLEIFFPAFIFSV